MNARNELRLSDLIEIRAGQQLDRDVLTFEHFSLDGGRTPDEVRSYSQLRDNGHRIAAYLLGQGMRKGDRFAIMMRNHPEFVEAMIAASLIGAVFVPIDPRTQGDKLAFMLRHAGCRGVVVADYALRAVQAARVRAPSVAWLLALASGEDGAAPVAGADPLTTVLAAAPQRVDAVPVALSDPLQIIYTSGTTGDPKGIVGDVQRLGRTGLLDRLYGYRPDDRPYTGLSFTHSNAQATALMPALHGGYRAVFSRRFTKSRLWDVCRRYGCTTFSVLGGMATALFAEPLRADDADNPVRLVISGGMPAAIWEAFEQRFGVGILEIYGASDGGGMAVKPPGVGPVGSIGRPIPGIVMKILDEEGNECPPGVVGEICCRPEAGEASVEYFGDASASHSKVREGWNRSGDMGHRDADGWLYFDYRRGGGIRRNGDFINPGFIERVIAEDPQIDDVFVYGVPARSRAPGDKDIVAAVVPVDPARFDVAAVFARCRALLEGNFVPGYLQVVVEIPKTASEKPREHLLLAAFDAGGPGLHRAS